MMSMGGGHRGWKRWGYGPGFPMGPGGPMFMGGPKAGRGDVRLAILHLLTEMPMHGYQIMQELAERTHGVWRPSPGAVYPTLQQLEDEGLVHADEQEGKKVYRLTDEGRTAVEEAGRPPWERFDHHVDDDLVALRDVGFQVGAAVMQVARAGSSSQVVKTREILEEARRQIYQILADDTHD
jgi:DNA-binding PadR family transcriptional regulator